MNLNEAQRKEYQESIRSAQDDFKQKKIFSAIEHLKEAEKIFNEDANAIFFRGLCYAELHEFDKAKEYYEKALELEPDHYGIKINMAEMAYFQRQWESAYQQYKKLLDDRGERLGSQKELTEFKVLVCLSYLSKEAPSKEKYVPLYQKGREMYSYLDDTPYFYYASALEEYGKGNSEKGLEWVAKAYRVFSDPVLLASWDKTLIDCGYLKEHELVIHVKAE